MHIHSPWFLLFLLLIPILVKTKSFDENHHSISLSTRTPLDTLPLSLRARLRAPILRWLVIICYTCLVIALSRPQSSSSYTETSASGHDIMLALDISGSMQAMDFFIDSRRVDRLSALKHVVNNFIDDRFNDRMGLVVFADHAYTQCPLTLDHDLLKTFVGQTEVGMAGQATAIGDALALSLKRINEIKSDSKVIVLVSDGKSNAGAINPVDAAEMAKKLNVKIHTIGIGSNEPAPFPERNAFGIVTYRNVKLEFDEKTLKDIAQITGGEYYNAKDSEKLSAIYKAIDRLEKREEQVYKHIEYEEEYLPFVMMALVAIVLRELLRQTTFKKIP